MKNAFVASEKIYAADRIDFMAFLFSRHSHTPLRENPPVRGIASGLLSPLHIIFDSMVTLRYDSGRL
jgi:hypothetical protein